MRDAPSFKWEDQRSQTRGIKMREGAGLMYRKKFHKTSSPPRLVLLLHPHCHQPVLLHLRAPTPLCFCHPPALCVKPAGVACISVGVVPTQLALSLEAHRNNTVLLLLLQLLQPPCLVKLNRSLERNHLRRRLQ